MTPKLGYLPEAKLVITVAWLGPVGLCSQPMCGAVRSAPHKYPQALQRHRATIGNRARIGPIVCGWSEWNALVGGMSRGLLSNERIAFER
jgi:hypothetical protein